MMALLKSNMGSSAVVVVYSVEEVGIEVLPLLEGILFAEDPRIHIEGYEGCLDDDSA